MHRWFYFPFTILDYQVHYCTILHKTASVPLGVSSKVPLDFFRLNAAYTAINSVMICFVAFVVLSKVFHHANYGDTIGRGRGGGGEVRIPLEEVGLSYTDLQSFRVNAVL